jgi:carbon storage regulator
MLVLSRRESERIKVGDSIIVTVVRVVGDKVRLGIEAPPNVLVLRDELKPHETAQPMLANGEEGASVEPARSARRAG